MWIARDKNNRLFLYTNDKPIKQKTNGVYQDFIIQFLNLTLDFFRSKMGR